MNKIFVLLFFALLFAGTCMAQDGSYAVGKTGCTIEASKMSFMVYWDNGVGNTRMFYSEELPNGNMVFEEYEEGTEKYLGKFIFKNDRYNSGVYVRADGKRFDVTRESD